MSETGAYLLGDVDWPQPKERMAAILRRSGLSVTVGSYALTVDDCSSFRFQEYGGDLGDPQIEAEAGSVEKMVADARLVSGALAQADVAHGFEVHDGDDRVVAVLEHTADPAAPAEGADRSVVERTMRIAFDLDGTLVPGGRRLEPGMERASVLTGWWFRERLRKGSKEFLRDLHRQGHEIWIYTSSLRPAGYIWWWFRLSGIPINGVVNQERHERAVAGLPGSAPSKHPPSFGIDLLVDDSSGVAAEGREHGFRVVEIDPGDAAWTARVRHAVERGS